MALNRRDFIVGAGVGAVVGAPGVASAAVRRVGVAPEARQSIGVIGTILQDGRSLTGFGWLTQVAGLSDRDLFTDPGRRGAETARLRWHAEVRVGAIDVLPSLFFGTGTGRLRIFFAAGGGAQPDQPDSFVTGRLVARYAGDFRNIQTVSRCGVGTGSSVAWGSCSASTRAARPYAPRRRSRARSATSPAASRSRGERARPTGSRAARFVPDSCCSPRTGR
jgi:hypothetical protein